MINRAGGFPEFSKETIRDRGGPLLAVVSQGSGACVTLADRSSDQAIEVVHGSPALPQLSVGGKSAEAGDVPSSP
jgi:hypothetical protein